MKKINFLYIFLFLGMIMSSCTDLTEEPFDILTTDNYFTDKNSVEAAVLRPYEHGHWCAWDGDRWMLQELTAAHLLMTIAFFVMNLSATLMLFLIVPI